MAQLTTVQFIKDSGFATGLTPTVTITEAKTWIVRGTFPMTEISAWNYIYDYIDGADDMLFFFNYDAWTDDVINRYQWNNNRIEVARWGWWGITTIKNNVINREQMEQIANIVLEKLPKIEIPEFNTKNIEERLGLIEDKINESVIEIDYWTILRSNNENALKITNHITKEVKSIKIPKQDNKPIINAIKKVEFKIDKIEQEDIKEIKEQSKKIKTRKEVKHEKMVEDMDNMMEDISMQSELDDLIEQPQKELEEFISSIKKDE